MAHVQVAEITPLNSYAVTTATAGPFTIPADWAFFNIATDLRVFNNGTELTYAESPSDATEFSISGTAVDEGFEGGTFTLGGTVENTTITLQRDVPIARTEDFPYPSPTLNIKALNTALDKIATWAQQFKLLFERSIRLPDGAAAASLELPTVATRASKVLAFDANGDVTVSTESLSNIEGAATSAAAAASSATSAASSATAAATSQTAAAASAAEAAASAAGGDVTGPDASTDSAVTRFDGTDGKTIQNSGVTIDDSDNLTANSFIGSGVGVTGIFGTAPDATLGLSCDLFIQYVSATTVDVDADSLVLVDSSGAAKGFSSVNLTADITASGANGLDTGSEANSTWYYIWVIGQSDGTVASLLSASATAPTMPAGYTFKLRAGTVYNDSSGDFDKFVQRGRLVNPESITSSIISSGAATSFTVLDLSAFVPPTAVSINLQATVLTSTGTNQVLASFASGGSGTTSDFLNRQTVGCIVDTNGAVFSVPGINLTTAQTIEYFVQGTNARLIARLAGYQI